MTALTGGSLFLLLKATLWQISPWCYSQNAWAAFPNTKQKQQRQDTYKQVLERTAVTFSWYLHGKLLFIFRWHYIHIFTACNTTHIADWTFDIDLQNEAIRLFDSLNYCYILTLLYINMYMLSECGNYFRILTHNTPILVCEGLAF